MRIEGVVDEHHRPYIPVYISVPSKGIAGVKPFLVDTGADNTVLSRPDARDLGMDYRSLPNGKGAVGVGRAKTKVLHEDIYLIFHADTGLHQERLNKIEILLREIPSLLGRDIIQKFRLVLTNEEVYLDR